MIDTKNKVILLIMAIAIILAININQIKKHYARQEMARVVFVASNVPVEYYMKGINFSKPVIMFHIKEGDVLIQYQTPNALQGNFYAQPGSKPDELGISEMGYDPVKKTNVLKQVRIYIAVKDTKVLLSYAASIEDNWSTPENEERTGGSIQIFTACKKCFMRGE
jgi:hypothetical protein